MVAQQKAEPTCLWTSEWPTGVPRHQSLVYLLDSQATASVSRSVLDLWHMSTPKMHHTLIIQKLLPPGQGPHTGLKAEPRVARISSPAGWQVIGPSQVSWGSIT